MKEALPPISIDVQQLRVGMFVHLDVGWMAHPFPLSSFKIASADQIATIRTLGRPTVRWSPEKSDPAPGEAALTGTGAADRHDTPASSASSAGVLPAEMAQAAVARRHKEALAEMRARLSVCERQFAEAAKACRHATELAVSRPQQAGEQAQQLSRALYDKMSGDQDMCIRLLTEAAGDKASHHALNVTVISLLMGRTFGMSPEDMVDLATGALMHDVGKVELPERVRHREEHFTTAESQFYQSHVAQGVALARKMSLTSGATLVVAQHHEHADGSGFPLKLNSDRMTIAARIVALVNRYDNLCNPAVPAKALTPHEALSLLFSQGKNRYDTAILGAFIRMMGVYPPGSTVQLTDDRYALVVSVNSTRPLKPTVLVHDAKVPREEALLLNLERDTRLGIRRSLKAQQMPADSINYLDPRPRVSYFFEPSVEPEAALS